MTARRNLLNLEQFRQGSLAPLPPPLREEREVMRDWRSNDPEVTICCAVYNHRPYIESALRGFLSQKTTFPFEILFRDDASNDGTISLLREYAKRYPSIVRVVLEPNNTYRQGERPTFAMARHACGRYIALCEGDDYWFRSDKLQRQYELLKGEPLSAMAVAWTVECREQGGELVCDTLMNLTKYQEPVQRWEAVVEGYYHTSTLLLRKKDFMQVLSVFSAPEAKRYFSDTPLQQLMARRGPVVLLPEVVSVYRHTGEGAWTSLDMLRRLEWDVGCTRLLLSQAPPGERSYYGRMLLDLHFLMWRRGRVAFAGSSAAQNLLEVLRLGPYFPSLLKRAIQRRVARVVSKSE